MTRDSAPSAPSARFHNKTERVGERNRFTHRLVTLSIKQLLRVLCRVDDTQLARVPDNGPLIIATNHVNFLEVPLVYTHLQPRSVTGFVKAETWDNPVLGPLLFHICGGIPLQRGEADMAAFRQALQALKTGRILAVAPEGTRSGHGRLQQGYPGIIILALRSGAPILPLVYYGGEDFWSNLKQLRRTDFNIVVGEPFYVNAVPQDRVTRKARLQMTHEIMYQMAALLPSAYRGDYSDLAAATETFLRFPPGAASNLQRA